MFGHTVRGPLRMLLEQLLEESVSPVPVLNGTFCDRLHRACAMAKENFVTEQDEISL